MQTKGFIRVLTYALLLICAFYLSFSFVSTHYQNKAEKKALAAAGIKSPDTSNEKYKTALNEYLDSLAQHIIIGCESLTRDTNALQFKLKLERVVFLIPLCSLLNEEESGIV